METLKMMGGAPKESAGAVETGMELQPRGLYVVPSSGEISVSKMQVPLRDQDDRGTLEDVEVARSQESANDDSVATTYPDGGIRAWLVVLGSTAIMISTYGLMMTGGLFITFWKENQLADYRETDIAWIIAMFVFLESFSSGPAGFLFDKFGARKLLFPCGLVYGLCFLGLSFATKYAQFMACFVIAGISGSGSATVAFAVLSHWFDKRKGLVMGVVTAGCSVGGIFFSIVLRPLLHDMDWRRGMSVLTAIMFTLCTIGFLCMKSRVPPRTDKMFDLSCFKSLKFLLTTLLCMGFELVLHSGWGAIPRYSRDTGLADEYYLMIVFNVGSIFGRLLPGYAMDKVGPFNVATSTAAFALMVMLCFWIPFGTSSAACLYAVAGFFGFGTGAFVSTSVACVVALCHARDAGKYLGSAWTVISLGVLASNPASHAVMDTGTVHLVWLLSATVGLSLAAGLVVRWECLGRRWIWLAKV